MTTALIVLIALGGLYPAVRVSPAKLLIPPLALMIGALEASAGGMLTALLPVPIEVGWLLAVVGANVLARRLRFICPPSLAVSWWAGGVLILLAGYQLRGLAHVDIGYDAHSIWFLHARWLYGGHGTFVRSLPQKVSTFSHPDYPYLGPSSIALVWRLRSGGIDYRAAQEVVTALNAAGALLVGGLVAAWPANGSRVALKAVSAITASTLVYVTLGDAANVSTDGYMDLLWSVCAAAGVFAGIILPVTRRNQLTALILLVAAGQTKNDAVPICAVAALMICMRNFPLSRPSLWRTAYERLPLLLLAILGLGAWPVIARAHGAINDVAGGGGIGKLIRGDPSVTDRIAPLRVALHPYVALWPMIAVVGVIGALTFHHRDNRRGPPWGLWIIAIASLAFLGVGFVANPNSLSFELSTSVDRVTIFIRLIGYVELASWLNLLGESLLSRREPRRAARMERTHPDLAA